MLISRVAQRSSSSSLSSGPRESAIGDRKGSLSHLKAMLRHDTAKTLESRSFVQDFSCRILSDSESEWIASSIAIRDDGAAVLYQAGSNQPLGEISLPQSIVIGHLGKHLIQITADTQTILMDCAPHLFVPVCTTLFVWSRVRPAGINNKIWLPPTQTLDDPDSDLLRCELEAHFTVYNPQYARWSPFLARLKRSGEIQLSDSQSQLIYTLQVHQVLGSRIKVVDTSVVDSNMVLLLFPDMGGPDSVYLKFNDIDDFEDWVATLKCLSLQPVATTLAHDALQSVRWRHKLNVQVSSCQQTFNDVDLTDTYVDICISRWVFARTCLNSDSRSANWGQSFDIYEPDTSRPESQIPSQLELKLKQKQTTQQSIGSEQDVTIGSIILPQPTESSSWQSYTLKPSNLSLNVNTTYSKVAVLDCSYYANLYEWMSDLGLRLSSRLIAQSPVSLPKLFPIYNSIFKAQGRLSEWILSLEIEEIRNVDLTSDTIFRESTLFTRAVESALHQQGGEILQKTIGRFVRKLVIGTANSLELDPARNNNAEEVKSNAVAMGHFLNYLWSLIKSEGPPPICKLIFRHMRTELEERGLTEDQLHKVIGRAISALLFLRFYVPALLNPQLLNLTDKTLEPSHRRTLVLVAKILQGFANRVKFGTKEMWLAPMNSFIEEHDEELLSWYLEMSGTDTIRKVYDPSEETPFPDRPAKELPVETFMGQQLTSPNLVDEWEAYAELVNLLAGTESQPGITLNDGGDPLVDKFVAECKLIKDILQKMSASLEQPDSFADSSAGPVPELFFDPDTMLFSLDKNHLTPTTATQKRSNASLTDSTSRFGWLPKSRSLNDETEESRQKSVSSVRKLTQLLRISKSSSR